MDQCLEWWDEMATRLMGRDKFANNFDEIVQVSLTRRNWLVVVCWPERFWTGVGCFQVLSYNKNNSKTTLHIYFSVRWQFNIFSKENDQSQWVATSFLLRMGSGLSSAHPTPGPLFPGWRGCDFHFVLGSQMETWSSLVEVESEGDFAFYKGTCRVWVLKKEFQGNFKLQRTKGRSESLS